VRCGWILNDSTITKFLLILTVKKSLKIGQYLTKLRRIQNCANFWGIPRMLVRRGRHVSFVYCSARGEVTSRIELIIARAILRGAGQRYAKYAKIWIQWLTTVNTCDSITISRRSQCRWTNLKTQRQVQQFHQLTVAWDPTSESWRTEASVIIITPFTVCLLLFYVAEPPEKWLLFPR